MVIEIDQSGHVEYTSKHTVVGDSLGNTILISAAEKRRIQKIYRSINKPKAFTFEIFALMVTYVIKQSYTTSKVYIIDTEYPGRENQIKSYIMQFAKKLSLPLVSSQITFGFVGKRSKSHLVAYASYQQKSAGESLDYKEVLRMVIV